MIFKTATFYALVESGQTDELGNPIFKESEIGKFKAGITQWTSEDAAVLDRSVTQNTRKLLTHAPRDVLNQVNLVELDGVKYSSIELVSDFTRWRVCYVKEYKE